MSDKCNETVFVHCSECDNTMYLEVCWTSEPADISIKLKTKEELENEQN